MEIINLIIITVKKGERSVMICFDKLWGVLKEQNVSTYKLRDKYGIDSKTIRRLKANENVETKTLDKLCCILHCKLEDIAEYIDQ